MNRPYFSIIIPTFNRAHYIIDTICSIKEQTFNQWECIIIDDGSTDESLPIIKSCIETDTRFHLFERDRLPKGPTACRNIGLKFAKAERIIFFDSDDLFLPWALESRYEFVKNNLEIDLSLFQACNFYKRKKIKLRANPSIQNYLKSLLSFEPTFGTPNPVWKKDFLNKIGGWNEKISVWDDPELHARAIINKGQISWGNKMPDCLIRAENIDEVKLTNFSKSLSNYESILDSYMELLNILNVKDKQFFKKNILNQIFKYSTYFNKNQICNISEWLVKNKFLQFEEAEKYKKLTINYFRFQKIPIIRKYFYKTLSKKVIINKTGTYSNEDILSKFAHRITEETSKEKHPYLDRVNLNL